LDWFELAGFDVDSAPRAKTHDAET